MIEIPKRPHGLDRPASPGSGSQACAPGEAWEQNSILIVDDEADCRSVLSLSLSQAGYQCDVAENGGAALAKLRSGSYDLLVTDIKMPDMDGLELFAKLREFDENIAVVMVTGFATFDSAIRALKLGASDFVTKPFNLEHVNISVERALERRRLIIENQRYQEKLEELVQERTGQLARALQDLEEAYHKTKQANRDTVYVLSKAAETNDEDTGMHVRRVGGSAEVLGRQLGLDDETVEKLSYSAELHDVGKVATHPDILRKPGKLTPEEFVEMKKHTTRGAEILKDVEFLDMAAEIALCHHEKFNGTGYPNGLKGGNIPLCARITTMADVFDALTSKRCYRDAMPLDKALGIIRPEKGEHFDPGVHDAFFAALDEVLRLQREYREG